MDTSENYIKMCEKAVEVQTIWCPGVGDLYWEHRPITSPDDIAHGYYFDDSLVHIGSDDAANLCSSRIIESIKSYAIWLPRQDQLQEMVDWKTLSIEINWHSSPYRFSWQDDPLHIDGVNGESMEQLWLGFVMKGKYGKTWDGEEWIKEV